MRLVLFTSKRCPVCEPLKEKLKALPLELKVIDIEESPTESAERLVFSAPTLILEEEGKEVKRWSGVFSVREVEEFLRRFLK
ncbi:thioredoxin family protein [Thermovibrio sp.]